MGEPTFQVRARGLDSQEGRQWSEVFADELTEADLAAMGPAERQEAEAWRAAIERAGQCTGPGDDGRVRRGRGVRES